ncbi:hypothetical protein QQF64_010309 [Cirrhinus molitorella]|uniref:Uncharacterized protein n=1 Tax=Cirrhinus molitorella TaxID=172907 RepID=A0ABR3M3M6_9TELE
MAPLEKWLSAGRVEVPQGAVLGPFSDGSPRALPRRGSISSQLLISKAHYFVLRLAVRQSSGAPAAVPPWPFTKPIIYFGEFLRRVGTGVEKGRGRSNGSDGPLAPLFGDEVTTLTSVPGPKLDMTLPLIVSPPQGTMGRHVGYNATEGNSEPV